MTDEEQIEKTLAGQREAFGELVKKYQNRLYTVAITMTRDPEEAKDAVQETFLRAYAHLADFHQASRFYTWLYRILFNNVLAILRKKKRFPPSQDAALSSWEELSGGEMPETPSSQRETAALLWKIINGLPSEYRAPIVLREIEGAAYDEIAAILKIPIGTVRSRLFRARALLRDRLLRLKKDLI